MKVRLLRLRHVNDLLFAGIVLVLGYIIIAPLIPLASFWLESRSHATEQRLQRELSLPAALVPNAPGGNRIVIPHMLLDQPINEGTDLRALRSGTWRRPNGSVPDKGGNTIIVGHRFTYSNPRGSFYYLDKLQPGDQIGVFWHGKRYLYKVTQTKTVPPNAADMEAASPTAELTLYTCTPLWLPKDRLVVIATPQNIAETPHE